MFIVDYSTLIDFKMPDFGVFLNAFIASKQESN